MKRVIIIIIITIKHKNNDWHKNMSINKPYNIRITEYFILLWGKKSIILGNA